MYQDLIDVYDKGVFLVLPMTLMISGDHLRHQNYQGAREQTVYDDEGNPKQVPLDPLQMLKASKWIGVDENGGRGYPRRHPA